MLRRAPFVVGLILVVVAPAFAQTKKPLRPVKKKTFQAQSLQQAIGQNNLTRVKELLEDKPELLNQRDGGQQYTPLHWATAYSHTDIGKYLMSKDADVNVKASYGYTPLHLAAMNRNKDLVEALLDKKADVNAQDNGGNTPLLYSRQYGGGDTGSMELLIKAGADVNLATTYKQTPLHRACQYGYDKVAILLLDKKADVNVQDNGGNTPLAYACQSGRTEIVRALLKKEASVK